MKPRRLLQPILALLLAVLVLSGSAEPASWLWTCRHSVRLVALPFAARPGEMPCGMPMGAMAHGDMPCCRRHAVASRVPASRAILTPADCHPIFMKTASLPPGVQTRTLLVPASSDTAAVLPNPLWTGASALTERIRKQRPPPDLPIRYDFVSSHGLRAPPAA